MAQILGRSWQLYPADPTFVLVAALREFELCLTSEQKLIYTSNYAKPGPADVIALVSRIDAESKGRSGRCVAPRLCTFLDCVVQFTGVVDTFVSSNPAVAALIWGSVKTAVLSASNVFSHFDKITNLVMQIGRTSPTLEQFGSLYSTSAGVQAALCNYYAVVVRLCAKIVEVSQRGALSRMFVPVVAPFESDFKLYIDGLAQAFKDIEIQATLATFQAVKEEGELANFDRQQNSAHRSLVRKFQKKAEAEARIWRANSAAREATRLRTALLNDLSLVDHVASWRQAKAQQFPGTAEWFEHQNAYLSWTQSKTSCNMWCSGKLGSGKTVLASNIISNLVTSSQTSEIVCYFFCQFDVPETLSAKAMISSLCRQLLVTRVRTMDPTSLSAMQDEIVTSRPHDRLDLVSSHLADLSSCYFIIDGLDDCEIAEIRLISNVFSSLARKSSPLAIRFYALEEASLPMTSLANKRRGTDYYWIPNVLTKI